MGRGRAQKEPEKQKRVIRLERSQTRHNRKQCLCVGERKECILDLGNGIIRIHSFN